MQEQENRIVMDEFNTIDDDGTTVYKLTGPVLVPQTKGEASSNVEKRLEFIHAEMYVHSREWQRATTEANETSSKRVETSIALKQQGAEEKRNEVRYSCDFKRKHDSSLWLTFHL